MTKINHVASTIRSPRKRLAINKAMQTADQFYLPPTEMYRIITEREEPLIIIPWNVFTEIIWQLYADLENRVHMPGEQVKHEGQQNG